MTEPDFFPQLIAQLKQDEGFKAEAYPDPLSGGDPWTIGHGQTGPGIHKGVVWTLEQAGEALNASALKHGTELEERAPWVKNLDSVRRCVLWNMAFQMGVDNLLAFKNTLAMVSSGNYVGAAGGMVASKWAKQTPNRAKRLARRMETGI